MMEKIKFSRSSWNGVIAKDFTLGNITKVAYAIARWLNAQGANHSIVLGHDCRFGGDMFVEAIAKVIATKNIRVYFAEDIVSSAMVSVAAQKLKTSLGIIITGKHFAPAYNGLKLIDKNGGALSDNKVRDIENLITEYEFDLELLNWNFLVEQGSIQYVNLMSIYQKHLMDLFSFEKIQAFETPLVFDAMYGSTQNVFKKLMPQMHILHNEINPGFNGVSPSPLQKNLFELEQYIRTEKPGAIGIAVDGTGDRIALYDEKGRYLSGHHLFLLITFFKSRYLHETGTVMASYAVSNHIEKLCSTSKLNLTRIKIGEITQSCNSGKKANLLVAGDESGNIIVNNAHFIDGISNVLLMLEWLSEHRLSLADVYDELLQITGMFFMEQLNIWLNRNNRQKFFDMCASENLHEIGIHGIKRYESFDGYKLFFSDDNWVLARESTWQPVIRLYAHATDKESAWNCLQLLNSQLKQLE